MIKKSVFLALLMSFTLALMSCGGNNVQTSSKAMDRASSSWDGVTRSDASSIAMQQGEKITSEEIGQEDIMSTTVIYFEYDSSSIRPEFKDILLAHANYLVENPSIRIALEGHTDQRGTREYNLALGERRGQAVRRQLLILGASESQVDVVSFGEERPDMFGQNEEVYSLNRRVELVY